MHVEGAYNGSVSYCPKKVRSLEFQVIGIEWSTPLWLFVSLEIVLKRTLGLFKFCYQLMRNNRLIRHQSTLYTLQSYLFMLGKILLV